MLSPSLLTLPSPASLLVSFGLFFSSVCPSVRGSRLPKAQHLCVSPPPPTPGWNGGGWLGPGWEQNGNNSYASLEIHTSGAMEMQPARAFVACSGSRPVITSLLSLDPAVTIHFKRSLCFLLKSNRLRGIFRLMVFGLEISKPFWSIIRDISRFPHPLFCWVMGLSFHQPWGDSIWIPLI